MIESTVAKALVDVDDRIGTCLYAQPSVNSGTTGKGGLNEAFGGTKIRHRALVGHVGVGQAMNDLDTALRVRKTDNEGKGVIATSISIIEEQ